MNYVDFIKELDVHLKKYFELQKEHICCKVGCSACCEKGDYPVSQVELEYLMQGYISLDNETKKIIQENIKNMVKGGVCPFLLDKKCSVYSYRPIVCRTHGLAYILKDNTVKLPYCVNEGKNFRELYVNNEFTGVPIKENLDTLSLLPDCGEIRKLYDWLNT